MMRRGTFLFWGVALGAFGLGAFLSLSRSALRLDPPAPPERVLPVAESTPDSFLPVTLSVTRADLERLAENRLPALVQGSRPVEEEFFRGNLFFQARKGGRAAVALSGGRVLLTVPIGLAARFRGEVRALGLGVPASATADGACLATLSVAPLLQADWTLRSRPALSVAWTRPPGVDVAGVRITFQGAADSFLDAKAREMASRFDAAADEALRIRDTVRRAWDSLREPIRLARSPELWLSVRPGSLAAAPLEISGDRAVLRASLRAKLSVVAGETPERTPPRALPPLRTRLPGRGGFRLSLPILLTYEALAERLRAEVVGRALDLGGPELSVESVRVYGSGARLVIALSVRARGGRSFLAPRLAGTIYLSGIPALDAERQVLSVREVSLDPGTKGLLARTAAWLLRPALSRAVGEALVFPLDGAIRDARVGVATFLKGTRVGEEFLLSGSLGELRLAEIRVEERGVAARAEATGVLEMAWRPRLAGTEVQPTAP